MTAADHALETKFCEELFESLKHALADCQAIRATVEHLHALAPTFPETRFCKGCVLPVVDATANRFLRDHFNATEDEVFRALRCEGFANLDKYYDRNAGQSYFSSFTQVRTQQPGDKARVKTASLPSPDFCIRYNAEQSLRCVGEVKYAPTQMSKRAAVDEVLRDLRYYLSVTDDPKTDWGHDFGFGVAYCGGGHQPRDSELIMKHWDSSKIALAYFWGE